MALLTLIELEDAAKKMAKGKSLCPNEHAIDFYVKLWPMIGQALVNMLNLSLECSRLPYGINGRMIVLLHKGRMIDALINYRPITLLYISYKLLAKAIQI